jgi:hypothetical protein
LSGTIIAALFVFMGMLIPQAVLSVEPVYSVVAPLGEETMQMIEMAPRLDTLLGKTVCLVAQNSFKTNVTMPAIAAALQERYSGINIVPYTEMPEVYWNAPFEAMPSEFRRRGCDAVISGNGG